MNEPATDLPAQQATCVLHPAAAASGACERCGNFGCPRCLSLVGTQRLCTTCAARALGELPPLDTRALLATIGLGATGLLQLGLGLVSAVTPEVADGEFSLGTLVLGLLGLTYFPVFVLTIVFFCRWFHLAFRYARAKGAFDGVTPASAVGTWFIPFVNLKRPFDYTESMLGVSAGSTALVRPWQVLWVVGNIASNASTRIQSTALDLISAAMIAAAAALAIGVVRELTRVSVQPS